MSRLGPGWRVGMFSGTLTQPPCYQVLLFDPGPIRRVSVIVPISEVSRLQISNLYSGVGPVDPDPGSSMYDGESWQEENLTKLRAEAARDCPKTIMYQGAGSDSTMREMQHPADRH